MSAESDLRLQTGQVVIDAWDLCVDSADRREVHHKTRPPHRRALVHDFDDGLTVNFDNDYPGGVTLNRVRSVTTHKDGIHVAGNVRIEGRLEVTPTTPMRGALDVAAALQRVSAELEKTKQQLANAQANWRWCKNCEGLFFAGHASKGVCPAGGEHTLDGSGNYHLVQQ
jgi:hypothetical protein